jgi:hypothetical protein
MFYIAYFNQSPLDPRRFGSMSATKKAFKADTGDYFGSTHADVYECVSEESWEQAERFTGIGCPFDGIGYRLTLGPRGGVLTERG